MTTPLPAKVIPDRFQLEAWAIIQLDLLAIAKREHLAAWRLGVRKAEAELRVQDLHDPRAQAFILESEYRSIRSLTAKTSIVVQQELLDGVRRGLGVDDVAKALDAVLMGRVATVDTIARTETNRAASWGRMNGWKKSGIVKQKEAIATLDDRVRPDHLACHGEVVPLDAPFTRGAASGKLAPPWDPNCRCAVAPVTRFTEGVQDGEVVEDAEAGREHAEELGLTSRGHVPGLIAQEDVHRFALRAGWEAGRLRFQALLVDAND